MNAVRDAVREIDLAADFSPTPLGRTRRQGRFSGEAFREDVLRPALEGNARVIVDLDRASGLSTGFLDEAFAGLVRDRSLTEDAFWERVTVVATRDPFLLEEIKRFIHRAALQLTTH